MKSNFWKEKKVLVTGGTGFLGAHLMAELYKKHPKELKAVGAGDYDLMKYEQTRNAVKGFDVVIHLAAKVGGIGYNKTHPVEMFEDNMLMGMNVIKACHSQGVGKLVVIGTICSYPKFTEVPFKETDLWNGYPEETNAPYGISKKALLVLLQSYREQFNFNGIFLMPVNMYGPGDNFDPKSSHVIPALIRRMVEAKKNNAKEIDVWGTGKATREFLYVSDSAEGIAKATELYNLADPVNIGSGKEISIYELSQLLKKLIGYKGKIVWDKTKPDGQPRRSVDITKAEKEFGFRASTSFEEGIKKTIDWYLKSIS